MSARNSSTYTDWKLEAIKLLIDNLEFVPLHSHDDRAPAKLFFTADFPRHVQAPL